MERRIRSFVERRGAAGPGRVPRRAAARPRRARRVPRPRDDQRLPAVAQPGAVGGAAHASILPELAAARPAARLERRLAPTAPRPTRSPRSAARPIPRTPASRSSAPTSTAAWSPAPASGVFTAEDARTSPPAAAAHAGSTPTTAAAGRPAASCAHGRASRTGDLLRMPVPPARYDLVLCRNTVIYFTEEVRDALHARLAESLAPGRLPRRRRHRARRRSARRSASSSPTPSSTARR